MSEELEFMKIFLLTLTLEEWHKLHMLGSYRHLMNKILPAAASLAQKWPALTELQEGKARAAIALRDEACVALLATAAEVRANPTSWIRVRLLKLIGVEKPLRLASGCLSGKVAPPPPPTTPTGEKRRPGRPVQAPAVAQTRVNPNSSPPAGFDRGSRWPLGFKEPVYGRLTGRAYVEIFPSSTYNFTRP